MENIEVLDFVPKRKKLKKWVKVLLSLFIIILVLFVVSSIYLSYLLSAPKSKSVVVNFTINDGDYVDKVGKRLEKEGLIRNFFAYKIYVRVKNINSYKAGTYKLDKSYSVKKNVRILTGNDYKSGIKITFKEGKNIRDIAKLISKNTNITESEFYKTLEDESYIDSLISKYWFLTDDIKNKDIYYPLEGYLYPETYTFSKNEDVKVIIEKMLDQTDKVFTKYKTDIENNKYSINEIVTLASIIEKEALYNADKKNISGVFYNRLEKNISLGSDVTTYYAFKVDMGSRELTKKEFNTYNPYNTRGPLMEGKLPVGAISNFGIESLEAAISPNKHDYLFFVADKNGKTYFTKTDVEHQKVIKELKDSGLWKQL